MALTAKQKKRRAAAAAAAAIPPNQPFAGFIAQAEAGAAAGDPTAPPPPAEGPSFFTVTNIGLYVAMFALFWWVCGWAWWVAILAAVAARLLIGFVLERFVP